ncbi:MAG TPA: hypothetical protein VGR26_01310 [Acidimicrobiales bacterium]|nr:hypothetical protein [Acidimicrobiales bacterium]
MEPATDLLALATAAFGFSRYPICAARNACGSAGSSVLLMPTRVVDWTAMESFWVESGEKAERRHDDLAHQAYGATVSPTIPAAITRALAAGGGCDAVTAASGS